MSRSPQCVSRSPVVEDTLDMISIVNKANQSLFWGAINVLILAFLLYDILYKCPSYTKAIYYGELGLAAILFLNIVFHVVRYLYANWWMKPVVLTKKQRRLMGVDDMDPHFKNPSETTRAKSVYTPEAGQQRSPSPVRHTPKKLFSSPSSSPNMSPMTPLGSPSSLNSSAFGNSSASVLSSPNYSLSSPSWIYNQPSPAMPNLSATVGTSPYSPSSTLPSLSPFPLAQSFVGNSPTSPIFSPGTNANDLGRLNTNPRASIDSSYMNDLQGQSVGLSAPVTPMKSSQWSPISPTTPPPGFNTNGTQNQPSLISRCAYQLAPLVSALTPGRGRSDSKKRDDSWTGMAHSSPLSSGSSSSPSTVSPGSGSALSHDLWQRCGVNIASLERWTMNLRVWISETVVERVVREIDAVNEALGWNTSYAGMPGNQDGVVVEEQGIGHVGLDRLRSAAQLPHIVAVAPNLSLLIPFLEATQNQKYLVARLRKLAEGGCMSSFNWNGDVGLEGSASGRQVSDISQCPTDAFIVAHLFATYLDTQMPSLPPSAVFLSQDTLKTPASVLSSMAVSSQSSSPTTISPNPQSAFFPLPLESPESRPFSIRHFARIPEELAKKKKGAEEGGGHMIIYQASQNPPHFQLVTTEEVYDVGKGRNNLFHTILLFLYLIKTKEHGMLGRVSLGKSGINLLSVIDGD